jgi:hypothetical protein
VAGTGYDAAIERAVHTDRRADGAVYRTLRASAQRLAYTHDPASRRLLAADAARDALALLVLAGGGADDLQRSVGRAGTGLTDAELGATIHERISGVRRADPPTPPGGIRVTAAPAWSDRSAHLTPDDTRPAGDPISAGPVGDLPPRPRTDHIHSWPNPYTSCTCGERPPGSQA